MVSRVVWLSLVCRAVVPVLSSESSCRRMSNLAASELKVSAASSMGRSIINLKSNLLRELPEGNAILSPLTATMKKSMMSSLSNFMLDFPVVCTTLLKLAKLPCSYNPGAGGFAIGLVSGFSPVFEPKLDVALAKPSVLALRISSNSGEISFSCCRSLPAYFPCKSCKNFYRSETPCRVKTS